ARAAARRAHAGRPARGRGRTRAPPAGPRPARFSRRRGLARAARRRQGADEARPYPARGPRARPPVGGGLAQEARRHAHLPELERGAEARTARHHRARRRREEPAARRRRLDGDPLPLHAPRAGRGLGLGQARAGRPLDRVPGREGRDGGPPQAGAARGRARVAGAGRPGRLREHEQGHRAGQARGRRGGRRARARGPRPGPLRAQARRATVQALPPQGRLPDGGAAVRVRVASAGTGKTTSLVRRYLELIGEGCPLRRIAGVTYTRAAAAELRGRVGAGLREVLERGSYLGGLYTPPAGIEPFAQARREPGGALLKTIHGFMVAGLRLSAPLLGLDPRFEMVAEGDAAADFAEELASLRLLAREEGHELHGALHAAGEHAASLPLEVFERRSLARELTFDDDPVSQAVGRIYRAAYARLERRYAGRRLGPGEVERAALRMLDHPAARRRLVERYPVVLV